MLEVLSNQYLEQIFNAPKDLSLLVQKIIAGEEISQKNLEDLENPYELMVNHMYPLWMVRYTRLIQNVDIIKSNLQSGSHLNESSAYSGSEMFDDYESMINQLLIQSYNDVTVEIGGYAYPTFNDKEQLKIIEDVNFQSSLEHFMLLDEIHYSDYEELLTPWFKLIERMGLLCFTCPLNRLVAATFPQKICNSIDLNTLENTGYDLAVINLDQPNWFTANINMVERLEESLGAQFQENIQNKYLYWSVRNIFVSWLNEESNRLKVSA